MGDDGFHSVCSAISEDVAWGELGRNGPSRPFAGDSDRLPGIGSSPDRVGGDECMADRISRCTDEVSHKSKALSMDTASPAGKASMDDRVESRAFLVFVEEGGPTLVAEDRLVDAARDFGVLGGECRVGPCDGNEPDRGRVSSRLSSIGGSRMPKSRSSRPIEFALSTFCVHKPRATKTTI